MKMLIALKDGTRLVKDIIEYFFQENWIVFKLVGDIKLRVNRNEIMYFGEQGESEPSETKTNEILEYERLMKEYKAILETPRNMLIKPTKPSAYPSDDLTDLSSWGTPYTELDETITRDITISLIKIADAIDKLRETLDPENTKFRG